MNPGNRSTAILNQQFGEAPQAVGEQRFVTLGLSDTGNLLVVVYTHREPDAFRVISAWKANRRQRTEYEKNRP